MLDDSTSQTLPQVDQMPCLVFVSMLQSKASMLWIIGDSKMFLTIRLRRNIRFEKLCDNSNLLLLQSVRKKIIHNYQLWVLNTMSKHKKSINTSNPGVIY